MNEDIVKISSYSKIPKINIYPKETSNNISIEKDLSKYFSDIAKSWAVSQTLVNNEDYSAKYYAKSAKSNIETATADLRKEIEENLQLAEDQVQLAKDQVTIIKQQGEEQVSLAESAANKAQEIANSLNGNYSDINLSNISENGLEVIKQNSNGLPIGTIFSHTCSSSYVPENCLPCDGMEYTQTQFPSLYTDWLLNGLLETCNYEEYEQELTTTGECLKWGLDSENNKFKIPFKKDIWITDSENGTPTEKTIRYFIVVATGSINKSSMDWEQWASSLENKANLDLYNCTNPIVNAPYVTSNYVNGASGYIIYSNKLCIQWGQNGAERGGTVVSLIKPLANANYAIVGNCVNTNTTWYASPQVNTLTTTNFRLYSYNANVVKWIAIGYIS